MATTNIEQLEREIERLFTVEFDPGPPVTAADEAVLIHRPSGGVPAVARWHLQPDVSRWSAMAGTPVDSPRMTAVPGVLWTHTPGPAEGDHPSEILTEIASHYWSGPVPLDSPLGHEPPGGEGFRLIPWITFFSEPDPCIACGRGPFPDWLAVDRGGRPVFESAEWRRTAEELKITTVSGILVDLATERWVAAGEDPTTLADSTLRYVALSADGTVPLATLVGTPCGLRELTEQDPACDPSLLPVVPAFPEETPAPRTQFGAALSGLSQQLFIVGGLDAQTGAAMPEVWAFDLARGRWRRMPLRGAEPPILAAATEYVPTENALYVLEQVNTWVVRLASISLVDGTVTDLFWEQLPGERSRFGMGVDPAGNVYVACSSEQSGTAVHRLEPVPQQGLYTTSHVVVEGPLAHHRIATSSRGISLVTGYPPQWSLIGGYRASDHVEGPPPQELRCLWR